MTAVMERVDWARAACWDHPKPDLWFPSEYGGAAAAAEARKVCDRCPIDDACREYALSRFEPHGVWGGLTTAQRNRELAVRSGQCLCGHERLAHRLTRASCRLCDCDRLVIADG